MRDPLDTSDTHGTVHVRAKVEKLLVDYSAVLCCASPYVHRYIKLPGLGYITSFRVVLYAFRIISD